MGGPSKAVTPALGKVCSGKGEAAGEWDQYL